LRRWSVYGNLAGNLLIRSYDRGERIHAAMLSRGFTGRLPTAEVLHFRASDALMVATACMAAAAVVLY
jgi:cobalt/nickel transport system permease protein